MRSTSKRRLQSPLAAAAALGLVWVFSLGATDYTVYVLTLAVLAAIVAIGLDVLMGYAGYISLAQGVMYGIGAYSTAILTAEQGWSFWAALPASGMIVAVVAVAIAGPVFRTHGLYFAVVTLGIALIGSGLFLTLKDTTGGASGYTGIPGIDPLPVLGLELDAATAQLGVALALLWIAFLAAFLFVNSRWGNRCKALREDGTLARSLGIHVGFPRLLAFVFAATCAGLAGSFFAAFSNFVSPTTFSLLAVGFQAVVIVVVGGMGTLWGALIGAALLSALPESLRVADEYSALLYGVVLLAVVLLAPQGIAGMARSAVQMLQTWRKRRDKSADPEGGTSAPLRQGATP